MEYVHLLPLILGKSKFKLRCVCVCAAQANVEPIYYPSEVLANEYGEFLEVREILSASFVD